MRWITILFCLLSWELGSVDQTWLKQAEMNVDLDAAAWLRENLKDELSQKKTMKASVSSSSHSKCMAKESAQMPDPALLVFISFSVPDATWLSLSNEIAKINGVFILRGLPNNSFQELAQRLLKLRQNRVNAEIQINPELFEKYGITSVPTFVISEEGKFDKVSGNISPSYAIDLAVQEGETASTARKLKKQLTGEQRGMHENN